MAPSPHLAALIEGWPMLGGRPLLASDLPPADAPEDRWVALARALRGQFSILAHSREAAVAVTDLTGSYPILANRSGAGNAFATSLHALPANSRGALSVEAIARFTAFGTVGPACGLVAGAQPLPGASVCFQRGAETKTIAWFDWPAAVSTQPAPLESLNEEFRSIVASWVKLHLSHGERVALLLSGGTDSALLAALLKPLLGDRLECITQDFFSAAYSEKSAAIETARLLQLPIAAASIHRRDYYQAFLHTNDRLQDTVIHGVQAHNLYCLSRFAIARGIDVVITGEHADSLFLGFGHFFRGLPPGLQEYREAIARAGKEEKLDRLAGGAPKPSALSRELLAALGVSTSEYLRYVEAYVATRRRLFEPLLLSAPLPKLQQLGGQIDGGVGWREICLPIMRAFPGCRVLCPFYDSDVIRFALRLPSEFIFRDGQTKYFLRQLLKTLTGLECPKRPAALSPLRYWRAVPHRRECTAMSPSLRALYFRLLARNILQKGALYNDVAKIAGLGIWMASHQVAGPSWN